MPRYTVSEAVATGIVTPKGGPAPEPPVRQAGSDPHLPTIGRRVAGFLLSATAVAATGFRRLSPEALEARLAVCRAGAGLAADQTREGHCDRYRPSDDRCGSMAGCGCYVGKKAPWAAAHCPSRAGRKTSPDPLAPLMSGC